jgi:hypothetical protein
MMGAFNKVYKGKADNAVVSKIVKEVLAWFGMFYLY